MYKSFVLIFVVAIFLLSNPAHAGNGHVIGNGGNGLLCLKNNSTTAQSYDLYEGSVMWEMNPVFSEKQDYLAKAQDIVSRLQTINPSRAKLYQKWLLDFTTEVKFLPPGTQLVNVPDVSIGVLPEGCSLVQTIVQSNVYADLGIRYLINSDMWNLLDEDQKASLVVHEILYREALLPENRHENSVHVRQFNQWLHADKFKEMSLRTYLKYLEKHNYSQADAHGVEIQLFSLDSETGKKIVKEPVFWNENSVKHAIVARHGNFSVHGVDVNFECTTDYKINEFDEPKVLFFDNQSVSLIEFPSLDDASWDMQNRCVGGVLPLEKYGFKGKMRFDHLEFSRDGQLQIASVKTTVGDVLLIDDAEISFTFHIKWILREQILTLKPRQEISWAARICNPLTTDFVFAWARPDLSANDEPKNRLLQLRVVNNSLNKYAPTFCKN